MQGLFNNVTNQSVPIAIALQGGGSYGAYTMGVLCTLLQSNFSCLTDIKAVSGTSAGALNGAVMTYGLNRSGPSDAILHLRSLWASVETAGDSFSFWNRLGPKVNKSWPNIPDSKMWMIDFASAAAPKGAPLSFLKNSLNNEIRDYSILHHGPTKLFVNAVKENQSTKRRSHAVFKGKKLNADTIISSGALEAFGGHKINGDRYFDGAYWRNPCFSDLKKQNISDLLVITLQEKSSNPDTPMHQDKARKQNHKKPGYELITHEVHNHLAHIRQQHPQLNLHVISLDVDPKWNETSRMNTDPTWLKTLEKMGETDAKDWLKTGLKALGKHSTYSPSGANGLKRALKP